MNIVVKVLSVVIWSIGFVLTIYLSGFLMFYLPLLDIFNAILAFVRYGGFIGFASITVFNIIKIVFSTVVAWAILFATSLLNAFVVENLSSKGVIK